MKKNGKNPISEAFIHAGQDFFHGYYIIMSNIES